MYNKARARLRCTLALAGGFGLSCCAAPLPLANIHHRNIHRRSTEPAGPPWPRLPMLAHGTGPLHRRAASLHHLWCPGGARTAALLCGGRAGAVATLWRELRHLACHLSLFSVCCVELGSSAAGPAPLLSGRGPALLSPCTTLVPPGGPLLQWALGLDSASFHLQETMGRRTSALASTHLILF